MNNDAHVQHRKDEYSRLMTEAREEYLEWERTVGLTASTRSGFIDPYAVLANRPKRICSCGNEVVRGGKCEACRIVARAEKHPPCGCGNPYFARGMCSKCYYKMYNKIRTRRKAS